jgi:hypothetical protein
MAEGFISDIFNLLIIFFVVAALFLDPSTALKRQNKFLPIRFFRLLFWHKLV